MHQEARSEKGLKLFGVRILCDGGGGKEAAEEDVEEVIGKSKSTGNLVACGSSPAAESGAGDNGYLSDGGLFQSSRRRRGRERKRGVPWTQEEHRTFLAGLKMLGKGGWRGISRNFVTTRTPTQVASHAQKYFLRQSNPNKKKRRSSLFDVVISDPAPAPEISAPQLSLKRSCDVIEGINHRLQHSCLEKTPVSITTQTAFEGTEASVALPSIKRSRETASIHYVNHMAGISSDSKDQVVPIVFLAPPLNISNQAFPSLPSQLDCMRPIFPQSTLQFVDPVAPTLPNSVYYCSSNTR